MFVLLLLLIAPADASTAQGTVFEDSNADGVYSKNERGMEGVRVSNGRDVVRTDRKGRYKLNVDDDDLVFVIKPRGFQTRVDDLNLPRFYYVHNPKGSPKDLRFSGVAPTGRLPSSIDFALTPQQEPDRFRTLFFGDTQPRNVEEVEYFTHDIIEDLIGFDGAFGVTLGDVVFDDLSVFEPHNQAVALIGMPWYNVLGNHDINLDAPDDSLSDETFTRVFGPATYSFDYGPVHYVVLDNVVSYRTDEDRMRYRGGLSEEQMRFMVNDLAHVSTEQLVVFLMHIPLRDVPERKEFFDIIKRYPHTLSIAGHTHQSEHQFFGVEQGNPGAEHHHYIAVTACGSWWSGAPDERGIPHATMLDGAPNGYSILTFDGHGYEIEYRAASEPASSQLRIWMPEVVATGELAAAEVVVNVFGGSSKSSVQMQVDDGEWAPMKRVARKEPYVVQIRVLQASQDPPLGRHLGPASQSTHIWVVQGLDALKVGTHAITVRTTNMHGRTFESRRVFKVR